MSEGLIVFFLFLNLTKFEFVKVISKVDQAVEQVSFVLLFGYVRIGKSESMMFSECLTRQLTSYLAVKFTQVESVDKFLNVREHDGTSGRLSLGSHDESFLIFNEGLRDKEHIEKTVEIWSRVATPLPTSNLIHGKVTRTPILDLLLLNLRVM